MPVRLIDSLATTAPLAELFSDDSVLRAMLAFEAALARVEGKLGIIPRAAASTISAVARTANLDAAAIAAEAPQSGTPAIPFLRALDGERARAVPSGCRICALGRHQPGPLRYSAGPFVAESADDLRSGPAPAGAGVAASIATASADGDARPHMAAGRAAGHLWTESRGLVRRCRSRTSASDGGVCGVSGPAVRRRQRHAGRAGQRRAAHRAGPGARTQARLP